MSDLTKSEQARINRAESKAPVTPEGPLASSMDHFLHGQRSPHCALLTHEDRAAFEALNDRLIRCLVPRNLVEADLVAQLASVEWRKSRVDAMELAVLNHEYAIQRDALLAANYDTAPALTAAVATGHLVGNTRLPAFLANRSAQFVRERAAILRTLEQYRKLFSDAASFEQASLDQQFNPDFGTTFEPHSTPTQPVSDAAPPNPDTAPPKSARAPCRVSQRGSISSAPPSASSPAAPPIGPLGRSASTAPSPRPPTRPASSTSNGAKPKSPGVVLRSPPIDARASRPNSSPAHASPSVTSHSSESSSAVSSPERLVRLRLTSWTPHSPRAPASGAGKSEVVW